jgi:hypothetical protein
MAPKTAEALLAIGKPPCTEVMQSSVSISIGTRNKQVTQLECKGTETLERNYRWTTYTAPVPIGNISVSQPLMLVYLNAELPMLNLKAADSAILNLQPKLKPLLKLNPLLRNVIHVAAATFLGEGSTVKMDAAAGNFDAM